MNQDQLDYMKNLLTAEIAKRRQLGGYNQDAQTILDLCTAVLLLAEHIKLDKPKTKKQK